MKTVFILSYRSGSTLFLNMMRDRSQPEKNPNIQLPKKPISSLDYYMPEVLFPPTLPAQNAPLGHGTKAPHKLCDQIYELNPQYKNFAWWLRISNAPHPYWFPATVERLVKRGDWNVIALMRDARNQTASWVKVEMTKGNITGPYQKAFEQYTREAQVRQQYYVDIQSAGAKLFRFEDMMGNEAKEIAKMIEAMGEKPNLDWLEEREASLPQQTVDITHSSFSDLDCNNRWKKWDQASIDYFKKVAGKGLIDLGYEKDDNWS